MLQDKPGRNLLRSWWQSVYRRHELDTGFGRERENFALDGKGNESGRHHEEEYRCRSEGADHPVVALKRL